jgi:5-methylcytosine-specific restriction endonuclease McrA
MNDILNKATVLVLNRNWQAINIRTPADAFCQMATNVATALEIESEEIIRPVIWDEWIALPIRSQDNAVHTVRGSIRVPTVIVLANFAKVPKTRPKLSTRSIRERDGNRCQYTGKVLKMEEGSIDHVLPRSRGGKTAWENCVWASKDVNGKKGNRLPDEAGLRLLTLPKAPPTVPVTFSIRNYHGIRDWEPFLIKTQK